MEPVFTLSLLGSFHATLDERTLKFRSVRVKALLAYLTVEFERPTRREALMELLWPGMQRESAQINLRQALYQLSRAISSLPSRDETRHVPFLLADRQTVQVNPDCAFELDVTSFRALFYEPTEANLSTAVALYHGEFLSDFYLPDSSGFEEWAAANRAELSRLALNGLSRLVEIHREQKCYDRAESYARRQLTLDSLRESAHRQLMTILAESGQRSAALTQYEVCRQLLWNELGIHPAMETTALFERIRAKEFGNGIATDQRPGGKQEFIENLTASGPRHNLPAQATAFVGREQELANIATRLAKPECRLLTLVGPGGSGKTRLALQAAAAQVPAFAQGVFFVSLASLDTVESIPSAIAGGLRFKYDSQVGQTEQLLNYLRSKELLLVLDNFEHMLEGSGLLSEILQSAPEVKLLVTSRVRLNIKGEWLSEVEGLPYPPLFQPVFHRDQEKGAAATESFAAVQLFIQSARRLRADFQPGGDESRWVAHICRLVEGMPLAVELAAAWIRLLSCEEIATEIEHSLDILTQTQPAGTARHRSVRAVFDHSWKLISPEDQAFLRRLAVFRGSFGRQAAEQIAAGSLLLLARLVDKSLLQRKQAGRYNLHELLRQFAQEKLEAAGELELTRQRHFDFFLHLAEQAEIGQHGPEQANWLNQLETEHDNLRAGLQWVFDAGKAELGARLAGALGWFWRQHSYLTEGRKWLDLTLAQPRDMPVPVIAKALTWSGRLAFMQGEYSWAKQRYEESLGLWQDLGDRQGMAESLSFLGNITRLQGDSTSGIALCEKSLALSREIGDEQGIARELSNLGVFALNVGDLGRAATLLEESLVLARTMGDKSLLATILHWVAIAASFESDYRRALAAFEESLSLAEGLGDRRHVSLILIGLGNIALQTNDFGRAALLMEQSLAIARDLGDKVGIAWSLNSLGELAFEQDHLDHAAACFEKSLAISRETNDLGQLWYSQHFLGLVAQRQGDLVRARRCFLNCLDLSKDGSRGPGVPWNLFGIAIVAGAARQPVRAARLLGAADGLFRLLKDPMGALEKSRYERGVAAVRAQLDEAVFAAEWAEGQAMSLEQAIAYAIEDDESS